MNFLPLSILYTATLFAGLLLSFEAGRRLGVRRLKKDVEGARAGAGAVEAAIFGLLGLVIAFTFSHANGRFETRRQLAVQEANHIGTAWLRLDLLPTKSQPALRELFRQYLDSRLATYIDVSDRSVTRAKLDRSLRLQGEIWTQAVAACQTPEAQLVALPVLTSLNAMFDIVTNRTAALWTHEPVVVFAMLAVLAVISALFAGLGMAGARRRSWPHILGFSLIVSLTVYVILDLEFPRQGLIRMDDTDQVLVEVRRSMK